MKMRSLLASVVADAHLQTTPEELLEKVKVSAITGTNLVQIEVQDTRVTRYFALRSGEGLWGCMALAGKLSEERGGAGLEISI